MPIIVNLDVIMAKRKIGLMELAEKINITPANLSILKNNNIKLSNKIKFNNEIENRIIKELSLFPEQINEILESNEPTHLTKYIFNLTQLFSKFYEEVNISNEEDIVLKSSRVRLLKCLIDVLTKSLKILGIETIDKI